MKTWNPTATRALTAWSCCAVTDLTEWPARGRSSIANELVAFVREEFGDHFHIEVACYPEFHPESATPQTELLHFRRKVEAGADGAITQYFYNPDSYFRFVDDCRRMGIEIPITPGIMPITNYKQLSRFSGMCGAEIPQWIRRRLEGFGDDGASIREFGLDVVTSLCERLLEGGAPGLHIYTLNRANASMLLWQRLNRPQSYFLFFRQGPSYHPDNHRRHQGSAKDEQ